MDKIQVNVGDKTYNVLPDTAILDLAKQVQDLYENPILLARVNGKLKELYKRIKKPANIEFIEANTVIGHKVYVRTAMFMLTKAVYDAVGKEHINRFVIDYTIGNGYFCRLDGDVKLDQEMLNQIKSQMDQMVKDDLLIIKQTLPLREAIALFEKAGMYDKSKLFRYRRASSVNVYSIDDFTDYNYGYMAPSTGCIPLYDFQLYDDGFVFVLPESTHSMEIAPFQTSEKLFQIMKKSAKWSDRMGISTVGELNDSITDSQMNDLILVQEALQEKEIADIAEKIAEQPSKKIVLIAGPSSSGKTTFSHRLSIQLRAHGLKPHPIPVDDYFVNREDTPRDEDGNYNYECLAAVDVGLFNQQMSDLIQGKEVEIPSFDFLTGRRKNQGQMLKINENDVLVIEGIHCLNEQLTYSLHADSKFKIYISALTQLNIDDHNRIPTTDGRMLRRIVRDAAKRGTSAEKTICMWQSVRRGEEENIFPYQDGADVMFNSALIYELSVLKQYAEPLLFSVSPDSPAYDEAKRLLKFLDYFIGVSSENVPYNSILREFIGGGCFKV